MLLNEKTFRRMKKLGLDIYVVNIDNDIVMTFEEWAEQNEESASLFTNTEEIGDISEYAVVADNENTARVLAYAEYYEYTTEMFLENLDDEDFDEVTAAAIPEIIPRKEG